MAGRLATAADLGDIELMESVRADDPDAFSALYDRFGSRAYRVAFSIARDRTRAEDIVQEAFLSIWRSRARYQPQRGAVVTWIMSTVRNRAIDAVRLNGRHDDRRAGGEHTREGMQAAREVEDTAIERDQAARLRRVLARLPKEQRDVICLAYFGELSASEIADELSIPVGTVKGRMRLGLNKLRAEHTPEPFSGS